MGNFKFLIGGALTDGHRRMDVINPATEQVIDWAPRASASQIDAAVTAAQAAYAGWAAKTFAERAKVLVAISDAVERHGNELANLLTREQGKPLAHANHEVRGMCAAFRHFAETRLMVKLIEDSAARRVELHRRPLGVVAVIIPWNFPLGLLGMKVPAALITGNTVVLKPAATTPLATLRVGEIIADIVPAGVLNVIADSNDLGDVLTQHPGVRKISFTGSTATGRKVMASAADGLKRITLELGGNDAGIVLDDADPQKIAPAIFQTSFFNSGQVCIALKRLYVHERIHDELVEALAQLAKAAILGDGLKPTSQLGPLQNRKQFERVKELLAEGKANGRVAAGGELPDGPGYFIPPTIICDISDGTRLVDEEQFGPVLPVIRYTDVEDALSRANASPYGLGGSVWSSDLTRAARIAAQLECGTAWINKHCELGPDIPFGGAKASGIGVEQGEEGLHEYTQSQVINSAK